MKWIKYIFTIIVFGFIVININDITDMVADAFKSNPKVIISKPNNYYRDNSFNYVKLSNDYIPYSKQDLLDIFYSLLNSGYSTFTFYCPEEYLECINDVDDLINNEDTLTIINNFVNSYNSFSNIKVIYSTSGEVNVEVTKLYNEEEIVSINKKIDEIEKSLYKEDMSIEDKILAIHDYIINNTKYDEKRAKGESIYKSNKAYGALIDGYAVCGGYADAMNLFLDRLNVTNYKISSDTHVWNAVYLNDKWLHLDLTWDDPITLNSNKDTLTHKFYLIDTSSLEKYKISDHDFNKTIYAELS